jgi:hypothetical protein
LYSSEREKRELLKKMSDLTEFEEKEVKKLDSILLDENQHLKIQLKMIENNLLEKDAEWSKEK